MNQKQLNKIKKIATAYIEKSRQSRHGFDHVWRVKENAFKIVRFFRLEKEVDGNLLQAACFLHDVSQPRQKPPPVLRYLFEGFFTKRLASKIIKAVSIDIPEQQIILNAVSKHSKSFPLRRLNQKEDLYTRILQDADTLDFFNKRRVKKIKNKNWFTKIISPLIDCFLSYGEKNLKKFLNFPEIAEQFYL